MELYFRHLGSGQPLIILHGLYGSSDNWYSIGRALSEKAEVFLPDQRNHGNSPHTEELDYHLLAADLDEFMLQHGIKQAMIMGHSMGGKTALAFGQAHPEKVKKMVIVDISPFAYDESSAEEVTAHARIIKSLSGLHPETLKGRQEADDRLKMEIPSPTVRQFLLKNLKRTAEGKYYWAINLEAMATHLSDIYAGVIPIVNDPPIGPKFPLLFVRGERSGYLPPDDFKKIQEYFPDAQLKTIAGAGHWVHAEKPEAFLEAVKRFLF